MVTKTPFWRLLTTVAFLILFFPGPAACQEARGTSRAVEKRLASTTRTAAAFPTFFLPTPSHLSPTRAWTTRGGFKI